jgi:putative heme-binding domain-containing protein
VAAGQKVPFVDLFSATHDVHFKGESRPKSDEKPGRVVYTYPTITFNGVHQNEFGDRVVARAICEQLFGTAPKAAADSLQAIRTAVLDKNFYWYHRYRTTDGYSTYGDRAFLRFIGGQSNYEVLQRELEVLDLMTANRDKHIWSVARSLRERNGQRSEPAKVDDSNLPPFIPVTTNKPGPLPGGKHVFLGGQEAIGKMTIGKNLKVELFASEEKFPELVNPVQMAFDTKGRLWVAAWRTYPHWKPTEKMDDKLLILEDNDGDGRADKCKTFIGDLHNPTGFEFWNGGVLVAEAPYLLFLKDVDGDDKIDVAKGDLRERVLGGLDTADTHHTANSFTLDPGGALYFQEGTFHHTQVETPWGPAVRCANAGVFRYEPRAHKFETYVSFGFANPHGHAFDHWGQDIVVDGTGANPFHAALFSGRINFPDKHNRPPQVYQQRTRPCPGIETLSSRHFPADRQGNLLVGNVIGFQGILEYKVRDEGSSFAATELEPILSSSDPSFRPADIEIGPDGAIWFTDWQNPIIGHMQHNLRDPSRDQTHGRVYRVTYEGRPLNNPELVAGQPVENLLDLLKHPEDRVRYRARIELGGRKTDEVIAAAEKWLDRLDKSSANFEHQRLEGLWLHQNHNVVNTRLLEQVLASSDFRARAAAVRVLCYWRDRVSNAFDLVLKAAADKHPRVRLEAVRAASFFTTPEAIEAALVVADQPMDAYIQFTHGETLRVLQPQFQAAVAAGQQVPFVTDVGARFMLRNTSLAQLLKMERTRPVNLELLFRPGVQDDVRREAVRGLAKIDDKIEPRVLIDALASLDDRSDNREQSVVFDLIRLLAARDAKELAVVRADLEKLATAAKEPFLRQIGFVALMTVDGSVDKAWALGGKSVGALRDLVSATPLVSDPALRARLYPKIEPLLAGLPAHLASGSKSTGTQGRYVRIELTGRSTLTLAEVEVMSEGRNVARGGKASQKNTAHGGEAKRAIDGNKEGSYGGGGQTHTVENTPSPWWEVDLGDELPIDQIAVYNRTDGDLGNRLNNFTLKVLDAKRTEVFRQDRIPAPKLKVDFALDGGGAESLVRRAAMTALVSVRGQELKAFQTLARYVQGDVDRAAAIRALQRIPRATWPKEEADPLVKVLLAHIRKIPTADRTSPAALDALEFADALATLLPASQAKTVRAELGELGVRVVRVGTLFERMAYDKDIIAIRAGKPVEFIFENTDLMPHNFVIAQPGSLEELGKLSEATAQQPDAAARHFVPQSPKVLLGSVLLQPRESQKLSFTAPTQPGVYPYVCTYPGHWRRMYGALYVVEDLDGYLANPEAYLASHALPIKDELLKDRRPRTEWKFEDVADGVKELSGRSFNAGKHLFTVASCVACHRLDGMGNEFGPDFTKLDPKLTPTDILKEILDPSAKINDKYQTNQFLLGNGKTVTGLVLEETPDVIKIIENPLAKAEPLVLKRGDIVERQRSKLSIMPKGLLDKLTRDEILDLVAFVSSRGNREHAVFQGAGAHDHGHGSSSGGEGAKARDHAHGK